MLKDLGTHIRTGNAVASGIEGTTLQDLKLYAQRWLAKKKKDEHPLLPGTPMCDEVHELLGLAPPPPIDA
jgi:hypothetical protein